MSKTYLWTSEVVSSGHPDKVADQIADAVLDAHIKDDQQCRCACEVTCYGTNVFLTGEITSKANVDYVAVAKKTLADIGYSPEKWTIQNWIREQSREIAKAVTKDDGEIGAGDQGLMFGYATNETASYMPLVHDVCWKLMNALEDYRKQNLWLHPDGKVQTTIQHDCASLKPHHIDTILVSACYDEDIELEEVKKRLSEIVQDVLDTHYISITRRLNPLSGDYTKFLINPAGPWHIGGPEADTGLSGRKLVVDNYGPDCMIGGGSFSGKDPTKVDRSAAYAARWVAKNIVAAKLATWCRVQIAYAIGVVDPVSLRVQSNNGWEKDWDLTQLIREEVKLSPRAIISKLDLLNPIYQKTASGGHFGRDIFPWEKLNLVERLLNAWSV